MTVSSTSSRVVYAGNGATTAWPFAFKVLTATDLTVLYTDAAGDDTVLSPAVYSVTGLGLDVGGVVTYPLIGSPLPIGTKLTIMRNVPVTQPTALSNQGAMWPTVIEQALDRLTYIAQRVADMATRSLRITPTDAGTLNLLPSVADRANSVLGFDAQGQPYAATGVTGASTASTWVAANWFPVVSPAAGRALLDVPSTGDLTTAVAGLIPEAIVTAKGSLVAASAAGVPVDFPVGASGSVVVSRPTASTGLAYVPALAGVINGLTYANNGADAINDIDVAAGGCMDATGATWLAMAARTKRLDAVWTVGTNQGGLDVGAVNRTISAASQANPGVLTIVGHGWTTGQSIGVAGVVGMVELNGNNYTITVVTPDTVSIGVDTTGFTAYTSGGTARLAADFFIWAIGRSDTAVADVLFSQSGTAPTMPTNYDRKRLIGWFRRAGGLIATFSTWETAGGGLAYAWRSPPRDVNVAATLTTARLLSVLSVPVGIAVDAEIAATLQLASAGGGIAVDIVSPDRTDEAPSLSAAPLGNAGTASAISLSAGDQSVNSTTLTTQNQMTVRTNTSAQIAARASAACALYAVVTRGFTWSRR